MKKRRKKRIGGIILTLIMALSMTMIAFAAPGEEAGSDGGTLVNNTTGHTYDVYQIFSGTQQPDTTPDSDDVALGDVKWGSGIAQSKIGDFITVLKGDTRFVENSNNIFKDVTYDVNNKDKSALQVAMALNDKTDDGVIAKAFANVVVPYLSSTKTATGVGASDSITLDSGYYLFLDVTELADGDAYNSALLQVTHKGTVTIAKKYDIPTVDKSVKSSEGTYGEAADYNIGDTFSYRIVGTLPDNYSDFEKYFYKFNDTFGNGLKYNGDAKVYVVAASVTIGTGDIAASDKKDITGSFTITPAGTPAAGGGSLVAECGDLKSVTGTGIRIDKTSRIVVEYTATLTADAVTGKTGNKNEVELTFSNNPNQTGTGTPATSTTTKDTNLIFTYELDTTKVDGTDTTKKLKSAEFVLYRNIMNGGTETKEYAQVTGGTVSGWTTTKADASKLTSDNVGKFIVKGLKSGTYYLEETKAPDGYNTLETPVKIDITDEINNDEANPSLTKLNLAIDNQIIKAEGTEAAADYKDDGKLPVTVENNSGAILPETGGMGTSMFYIIGSIMMIGAVIMMMTKKFTGREA